VWVNPPPVPIIVTVYVPLVVVLGTVIVAVEVPEPVTDEGLKLVVRPPPDELAVRDTGLLNPPVADRVILEVPDEPLLIVMLAGEVDNEKAGLVTVTEIVVR
jgi:hypothetical protein